MKIEQLLYSDNGFNKTAELGKEANLVLLFGSRNHIENNALFDMIRNMYPTAYIMGCSSSGEIQDNYITDGHLNLTAVKFEKSQTVFGSVRITDSCDFFNIGVKIASNIEKNELRHLFILTDGININGSKLVNGIKSIIGTEIPLTGGLAGDGADFVKTAVIANSYSEENIIVYAAFYGNIKTGCASYGGWDTFGIERIVTKSVDNIVYEINSKPALNLYKEYLGEKADDLPASGLRFPMAIRHKNSDDIFVRTMLDINEENNSIIFRSDVPEGSYCKLMKSNTYNLIGAAKTATELSVKMLSGSKTELAVIVSCFGRKFLLKQRTDEEAEYVRDILGDDTVITGYYSYGEIGPAKENSPCEMHNQTMTVTLFSEIDPEEGI